MSTNIQIDVLLQRLKQVSDQTAQQNRSEKQEREEALLLAQQAAAEGNPAVAELLGSAPSADSRNPQTSIDPLTGRPTQERSSVPDLYKKKRPAAQRLEIGKIAFCWHSLRSYDRYDDLPGGLAGAGLINSGLLAYSLKISNATRTQTLEVRGPDVPFATDFVGMLPVREDAGLFIWIGPLFPYALDVPIPVPPSFVPSGNRIPIDPVKATIVVLVTPDSLRQITPPSGLRDKMYEWTNRLYTEADWALTRHFGMVLPQGIRPENGNPFTGWWTPAAFKGLSGQVFGTTKAQRSNYAYMRQNFFQNAPSFFLAEEDFGANTYTPLRKDWRLTRFQPETIESVVPENQLRRAPASFRFDLADNNVGDQFTYAWDWNDYKYCKQQLLALGFTAADLKP